MKTNALEALTSMVHSHVEILKAEMRDQIPNILAFALAESKVRQELIVEVDLGPFKHKTDNGLPMRKAAF